MLTSRLAMGLKGVAIVTTSPRCTSRPAVAHEQDNSADDADGEQPHQYEHELSMITGRCSSLGITRGLRSSERHPDVLLYKGVKRMVGARRG